MCGVEFERPGAAAATAGSSHAARWREMHELEGVCTSKRFLLGRARLTSENRYRVGVTAEDLTVPCAGRETHLE